MPNPRPFSLPALLVLSLGCGGAPPPEVHEAPPTAPIEETPEPVVVVESWQHPAMDLPLLGTLDPASRIVMGETTIEGDGDGAFTLSGGEFSAPIPARWVENIVTSLQAPMLGLACPAPRPSRRAPSAEPPEPTYTISSGGTESAYLEGCTARRVRPDALALAASDMVGRIRRAIDTAARLEILRVEAIGREVPGEDFTLITTELDDGPTAPEGGSTYHRRIAWSGDHFELCTLTEQDPDASGPDACFALIDVFVAAIANRLREAHCSPGPIGGDCDAYADLRITLEDAIEWSPGFDLSDVGTQP